MNWTEILANALIPEPPGRSEAVADAIRYSAEKRRLRDAASRKVDAPCERLQGHIRPKTTNLS
jgi:hypothetical protein